MHEQEALKEQAEELKEGHDELYNQNNAGVNQMYEKANEALQASLDLHQEKALIDQETRNSELLNIGLEEEIDAQIDKKIALK